MLNAEDDYGVSPVLAIQFIVPGGLQHSVRLLQAAMQSEHDLQNLVSRRLALPHEDLVSVRFVQLGFAYDVGAQQPLFVEELLEVVGQIAFGNVMTGRELHGTRRT